MKRLKKIYPVLIISLLFCTMIGCEDWFDIRPKSDTIYEDLWKNEDDVLSVVGACYRAMNEPDFMQRLIVWGEVRSDNVLLGTNPEDDLRYLLDLNLNASNNYTKWESFYKVIGYCNSVIENAPLVRDVDPSFSESQLRAYLSEAKGIRALCYFTLVRTFRDIPFITDPVTDDTTKPFLLPQADPDSIINFLIDDLREIEESAVNGWTNNNRYTKGRITKTAIRALLADMYLWQGEYDNCILYCDKILNEAGGTLELNNYAYFNQMFTNFKNTPESIFELQFDESNIFNYIINELYNPSTQNVTVRNDKNSGQLIALDLLTITNPLFDNTDIRAKYFFCPDINGALFPIIKYVGQWMSAKPLDQITGINLNDYGLYPSTTANWIFYRLPDIYLMKAEALVEKNGNMLDVYNLVSYTYDRAHPDAGSGSLTYVDDQAYMRQLVLDERQREFMFEGKRYFDLLRVVKRENSASSVVNNYLMRKYSKLDQATVRTKLSEINALYMPINKEELRYNTALQQNPFYVTNDEIERN